MREFATPEARAYFTRKKEAVIGSFKERTAESDEYIAVLNGLLPTMNEMIQSADNVNGDELSEDDIHLFAALRAMSIVKGIDYPPAVEAYRFRMAERTSIDLHDDIAT